METTGQLFGPWLLEAGQPQPTLHRPAKNLRLFKRAFRRVLSPNWYLSLESLPELPFPEGVGQEPVKTVSPKATAQSRDLGLGSWQLAGLLG